MAEIDKLITEGENINENASSKFEAGVKAIEFALVNEMRKLFKNVDVTGGKITSNQKTIEFLAGLEARIMGALKESGYNSKVGDLLKNFDLIKANNIKLHDIANGVRITDASLTGIQRLEVQNTIDKLLNSGINGQFVAPMRESLYRNITMGGSVADAEKIIEDFVLTKGNNKSILNKYVGQVARDSISQFDGMIQGAIGKELSLQDFLYSGSIIRDSRSQCIYWVEKKILMRDELANEIQTALNKGSFNSKKCSGMIPGTNVDTFSANRGGYNCNHRAIAINGSKFKKTQASIPARIKIQKEEIAKLAKRSAKFAPKIDALGKDIAKKYGGTVTAINTKSNDSMLRKANNDYNGDVTKIKDAVRNTIILDKKKIDAALVDLKADKSFVRMKKQSHDTDPLGYSGNIVNVVSKDGVNGEIQLNTKWMIYAKEKEEDARGVLGNDVYDEIKAIKKLEGGKGHSFYEDFRTLDPTSPDYFKRSEELKKQSKKYYSNFLDD